MANGTIPKPLDLEASQGAGAWAKVGGIDFGNLNKVVNIKQITLSWNTTYNRVQLTCVAADNTTFNVISAY